MVSRSLKKRPGIEIYKSLDTALKAARKTNDEEIFIIGGGEIFAQAIGIADKMYLSYVKGSYKGDTLFPSFNKKEWHAGGCGFKITSHIEKFMEFPPSPSICLFFCAYILFL